jgi:hypothetical protein
MKVLRTGLLGVLAVASALMFRAPSTAADSPSPCPDSFLFPVPASSVPQGAHKDKNGNGIVCARLGSDGQFHGGPDDNSVVDDIVP